MIVYGHVHMNDFVSCLIYNIVLFYMVSEVG